MKASISFILCLAAVLPLASRSQPCPQGSSADWLHRGASCYRWFPSAQYWFQAEQTCLRHRGHLVSIGSQAENILVGRLANCSNAWIGRFGTDLNRLSDPAVYEWTDGSDPVRFERHNFSQLDSVHKPLIRTDGERWLNSLYHERHPFVCELGANSENSTDHSCPSGWTEFQQHCYVLPHFEANFNEANFYCQRNGSQLASVLTESELTFIKRLSFGINACDARPLDSVWLGLIKLNPCFPDAGGRELCYQWTDFSGKHTGFPRWLPGHPLSGDWTANCVALEGDGLRSDQCYSRRRFVCKQAAGNDTDGGGGGGGGQVDGLVAAFDFRKGQTNLVNPSAYVVRDTFGVPRTRDNGACFSYNGSDPSHRKLYYTVGNVIHINDSMLSLPVWTVYFDVKFVAGPHSKKFFYMDSHDTGYPMSFYNEVIGPFNDDLTYGVHTGFIEPRNGMVHSSMHDVMHTGCLQGWCRVTMSVDRQAFNVSINGQYPSHSRVDTSPDSRGAKEMQIYLGFSPRDLHAQEYEKICIKCFGIAHRRLSLSDVEKVMSTYCSD